MSKIQRAKRVSLFMSLSLIITFLLLIHVNFARAKEVGGIDPDFGFDIATLLPGQYIEISTSQTIAFDAYGVGVISVFNNTLTATLTVSTTGASGLWWITMMGTGGKNWFDFGYGLIGAKSGLTAEIDVSPGISFGIATGGTIVTSEVSSEDPFKYKIKVSGSAAQ